MARRKPDSDAGEIVPLVITPQDSANAVGSAIRKRQSRRSPAGVTSIYAQEVTVLVEATLKSRGSKGATPDILEHVVRWSRGVRAEGDELRLLSAQPRRQKAAHPSSERLARYEVNKALLEGVLAGAISLDVQEDGCLTFVHSAFVPSNGFPSQDESGAGIPTLSEVSSMAAE